jgi:hypothetical protein
VYGHRFRTAYVARDDRRTHAASAITLNPRVLGEEKSVELAPKVFYHITPLAFTMDEHVKSNRLLLFDRCGNLLLNECLILELRDLIIFVRRPHLSSLIGLWERADSCRRQFWEVQDLALDFSACVAIGVASCHCAVGAIHTLLDVRVIDPVGFGSVLNGPATSREKSLGPRLIAIRTVRQCYDFSDLRCCEREP